MVSVVHVPWSREFLDRSSDASRGSTVKVVRVTGFRAQPREWGNVLHGMNIEQAHM